MRLHPGTPSPRSWAPPRWRRWARTAGPGNGWTGRWPSIRTTTEPVAMRPASLLRCSASQTVPATCRRCIWGQVVPDLKLWFKNDSGLDTIRSHPRYARLLELAGWQARPAYRSGSPIAERPSRNSAASFLCHQTRCHRCGPMRAKACWAQNTWLCRLAIHCRPAAVTFRYVMASPRCGETLFQ
jgi:hypothetical protein